MTTRPASSERREQILQAAARVIAERGACEVRISDIAEVAETSTGLLLYYFRSKDELLAEALTNAEDRYYADIYDGLAAIDDPRARLAHLISSACPATPEETGGGRDHEWALWLELWARALRDETVAGKRAVLDRRWRATIADVVEAGQRRGLFADVDPKQFALELASLMDGLAVQVLLNDSEVDTHRMERMSLEFAMYRLQFTVPDGDGSAGDTASAPEEAPTAP